MLNKNQLVLTGLLVCASCDGTPSLGPGVAVISNASPTELALDGNTAWFSNGLDVTPNGFTIAAVASDLSVHRYSISQGVASHGIAINNRTVWFLANRSSTISSEAKDGVGRLDVSTGSIQVYDIPTAGSFPEGLAISASGSVYVAETNANAIAEIRNGNVVEHRLPGGLIRDSSGPGAIAITADGTVYTIVERSHEIVSLSPTGKWEVLSSPNIVSPSSLAAVGNLIWFSDPKHGTIGSMSRDRRRLRTSVYRLPWPASEPMDVVANKHRICFTIYRQAYIGCYAYKAGRYSRVAIPSAGRNASAIAMDGDRVWFALGRVQDSPAWYGAVGSVRL